MLFLAFLVWNWLFGLFAANWVILALSHSKQRFCCFVANFLFSAVFALKKKGFNPIAANHALLANSSSYHVYETLWINWNLVYPCSSHSENTNRSVPKLLYWYYESHYFLVLSWVAEYISTFVAFFHKYISRFSGRAVFLSKHVGHYPKPTYESSLFSLSNHFGWQNILVSEWICISNSVITLVD